VTDSRRTPASEFERWLESRDFYEMCQQYRHANEMSIPTVVEAFEGLKLCIMDKAFPLVRSETEESSNERRYHNALHHIAMNGFAHKDWKFAQLVLDGKSVDEAKEECLR
jgi:hypothetical protein